MKEILDLEMVTLCKSSTQQKSRMKINYLQNQLIPKLMMLT